MHLLTKYQGPKRKNRHYMGYVGRDVQIIVQWHSGKPKYLLCFFLSSSVTAIIFLELYISHAVFIKICSVKQWAVLSMKAVSMIGLFVVKTAVYRWKTFSLPFLWHLKEHLIPLRNRGWCCSEWCPLKKKKNQKVKIWTIMTAIGRKLNSQFPLTLISIWLCMCSSFENDASLSCLKMDFCIPNFEHCGLGKIFWSKDVLPKKKKFW